MLYYIFIKILFRLNIDSFKIAWNILTSFKYFSLHYFISYFFFLLFYFFFVYFRNIFFSLRHRLENNNYIFIFLFFKMIRKFARSQDTKSKNFASTQKAKSKNFTKTSIFTHFIYNNFANTKNFAINCTTKNQKI